MTQLEVADSYDGLTASVFMIHYESRGESLLFVIESKVADPDANVSLHFRRSTTLSTSQMKS
jgi:hypothetical protein